jgi:hypothetical protein
MDGALFQYRHDPLLLGVCAVASAGRSVTTKLFYNTVMSVVDVAILRRLRAKRSIVTAGGLAVIAVVPAF